MKKANLFSVCLGMALFPLMLSGQPTFNDAVEEYNKGVVSNNADSLEAAIAHFEKCIEICTGLGEEGEEKKIQTQALLPNLYYGVAMKSFRAEKLDEALLQFKKTVEVASLYNDQAVAEKASKVIPQLHYQIGNDKFAKNDMEGALAEFNKAIELDPGYSKAYYNLARVYRKQDNMTGLQTSVDKAIELATAQNDAKTLEASKNLGRDYFLVKANNARTAKKNDDAIKFAQITLGYDEKNATAHYILAAAYNSQSKWDNAIASAGKALEYEQDDAAKEAKIYYELGIAYAAKADKANACASYKKAAVGPFQQASEYQIKTVLKCE
jgi:tetratricopeptide (TPR) repeat protein